MSNKKYYAGIGSRETPVVVMKEMTRIANYLERQGYTLRSGGADGADTAFSNGCKNKEIIIPWGGFNGLKHNPDKGYYNFKYLPDIHQAHAKHIAKHHHKNWVDLSDGGRLLHSRNVIQILGLNLNKPVSFVICWTALGQLKGGTAQAIRVAMDKDIPVFNLGSSSSKSIFQEMKAQKFI